MPEANIFVPFLRAAIRRHHFHHRCITHFARFLQINKSIESGISKSRASRHSRVFVYFCLFAGRTRAKDSSAAFGNRAPMPLIFAGAAQRFRFSGRKFLMFSSDCSSILFIDFLFQIVCSPPPFRR
jgi:hypothetical protein